MPTSDNPSIKRLVRRARDSVAAADDRDALRALGVDVDALAPQLDAVPALAFSVEKLATVYDRFNAVMLDRDWVAFEMLPPGLLEETIALANRNPAAAEQHFLAYFTPENIAGQLKWVTNQVRAGSRRARLFELARIDYAEGRYHASILVVLSQLDGMLADVGLERVFSGDAAKMLVLADSMTAHPDVLPVLFARLSRGRRQTIAKPLLSPERHTILHGRSLAYDQLITAAKAWGLLFAVRDYAVKTERATGRSWPDLNARRG